MDPFEVLGVARDATTQQVEARWRELAWALHPDQHPGADAAERARLTAAMAELNEARRVVLATLQRPAGPSSPTTPTGPGATSGTTAAAGPDRAQPRPPESPPPGAVRFVVGTVVGVLLLLVLVVVVVVVVATSDDRPAASTTSSTAAQTAETVAPTGPPTTLFVEWAIGSCISTGELVVPVDCGAPNAGRIVLRATAPEFCPDWAEAYVRVDTDVWCVDEDS